MIVLTPFFAAAELENIFIFGPGTNTIGSLTVLKASSSVPRTTTSDKPCAVPYSTLFPAVVIFMGVLSSCTPAFSTLPHDSTLDQ